MCTPCIYTESFAAPVLPCGGREQPVSSSQAADNVTVAWQICTSACKAPSQKKTAKRRRNLEAAWVTARKPKNCLYDGGRVAERSVKAASKISKTPPALAPMPASADWEGDTSYLADGRFR
jgi:hypothetical protein